MITRRTLALLVAWLPVLGLLMVTSAPPGSPQTRVTGHLRVTPAHYYGGEALTWRGDIGPAGRRRVHLQKRGGPTGSWTDVDRSTRWTRRDGSFRFTFPAPAMNGVQYRVVGGRYATRGVTFSPRHQEVEVAVRVADPRVPAAPPSGQQLAVAGEPFTVRVDTAPGAAPVLAGRGVSLWQRTGGTGWAGVASGTARTDGLWLLPPRRLDAPGTVVYRARTADWTKGGDRVGWYLSFPTYVRVVTRPQPVTGLVAGDVTSGSVRLRWDGVTDPAVEGIVVARVTGTGTPTVADAVAHLGAGTTTYVDSSLAPERQYTWRVFTVREAVGEQGVFSATAPSATATTLPEPDDGRGGPR